MYSLTVSIESWEPSERSLVAKSMLEAANPKTGFIDGYNLSTALLAFRLRISLSDADTLFDILDEVLSDSINARRSVQAEMLRRLY